MCATADGRTQKRLRSNSMKAPLARGGDRNLYYSCMRIFCEEFVESRSKHQGTERLTLTVDPSDRAAAPGDGTIAVEERIAAERLALFEGKPLSPLRRLPV